MLRKIFIKALSLVLCLAFLVPPASAGVVKKLVEVDTEERERLEAERIRLQEEYEAEARKLAAEKAALEAQRRRLEASERLREEEINKRNQDFLASEEFQAARQSQLQSNDSFRDSGDCDFLCKIFRFVTFPVRVVLNAFDSKNS